jgi:hypothetical protein
LKREGAPERRREAGYFVDGCVTAYAREADSDLHVVLCRARPARRSSWSSRTRRFQAGYEFDSIIIDGANKQAVEEMRCLAVTGGAHQSGLGVTGRVLCCVKRLQYSHAVNTERVRERDRVPLSITNKSRKYDIHTRNLPGKGCIFAIELPIATL